MVESSQAAKKPTKTIGLTTWILISLAVGVIVGIILSMTVPDGSPADVYLVEGVLFVLGQWFIRLMQMLVVPLVFCSIVCGAASMSDPKLLGKVGVGTIVTAFFMGPLIAFFNEHVAKPMLAFSFGK